MKRHGLVQSKREANWMVYALPARPSRELKANLACLQDCAPEERIFREDATRLTKVRVKFGPETPACVREPGAVCAD